MIDNLITDNLIINIASLSITVKEKSSLDKLAFWLYIQNIVMKQCFELRGDTMAKQIEGVYENVLRFARQEFLEKGFALASLRDIAKAAGTSTGSIYTRFTDKAGLFRALVEPAAGELKRRFLEIQESFHRFDGQTQQEEMGRYTAHAQEGLFDYIYEHLPEFELLLRRAAGTEYAHYIDELVEIEVSYTYKYMEVIGCESVRSGQVTEDLIHIVTTAYFNGMFEPVRHRMDKARALHYIRQLNRYHMAGFETIFHPENFR